jgi:NAD(P)H-flavin reductase/nitrite reductase/ring-hydroxylating ferredoxin subunit
MATVAVASEPPKFTAARSIPGFEPVSNVSDVLAAEKGLLAVRLPATGTHIVLVHHKGNISALYGLCPHKDADLALGDIEDSNTAAGTCVKCPRHRKKFNGGLNFSVTSGASWVHQPCVGKFDPAWSVPVFDVQMVDGVVYVSSSPSKGIVPPTRERAASDEDAKVKGSVAANTSEQMAAAATKAAPEGPAEDRWMPCIIQNVTKHTEDSHIYRIIPNDSRFRPPHSNRHSWHVSLLIQYEDASGKILRMAREYTPISSLEAWEDSSAPSVDLLIKHYKDGKFTSKLAKLRANAPVWLSAPETTLSIPALRPHEEPVAISASAGTVIAAVGHPKYLLLISGGTGMTPMLQVLQWAVTQDITVFYINSNYAPEHGLMADVLAGMAREHGEKLRVLNTFTRSGGGYASGTELVPDKDVGESLKYTTGRVSPGMLKSFLPSTVTIDRVVVSGPRGMYDSVVEAMINAGVVSAEHVPDVVVELDA